jgi:hypothetical protein
MEVCPWIIGGAGGFRRFLGGIGGGDVDLVGESGGGLGLLKLRGVIPPPQGGRGAGASENDGLDGGDWLAYEWPTCGYDDEGTSEMAIETTPDVIVGSNEDSGEEGS